MVEAEDRGAMLDRLLVLFAASAVAGCSLTPIPDLTSQYSEPCDLPARSCPLEFKLHAGAEKSVELRGDFRADGWTRGEAMVKQGDSWTTTVPVTWGAAVQYKFVLDGTNWELDPANSMTGTTAGTTNSQVSNVTCAKWSCSSHSG